MTLPPKGRLPVFLNLQVECRTCGQVVEDLRVLNEQGPYCSVRCRHARGLPTLFRQAA